MVEFVRHIPGPLFLAVFWGFSILCFVLMRALTEADGQSGSQAGQANLDPVAIAMLQGGVDSVIRSRVFSLMNQNLAVIEEKRKQTTVRATGNASPGGLSGLDKEVLSFISRPRMPRTLFRNREFRAKIEGRLTPIRAELEQRNIIRSEARQRRALKIALFFAAFLAAFGGLKLYLGAIHDKPVGFLIISIIVSEAAVFFLYRRWKYLTRAGRSCLKELRESFKWTLNRKELPQGVDAALLVALYGAGLTSVGFLFPQYSEAFRKNAKTNSGCSGGCGGTSSSSDGSSGGGCGGCGGCGGD